MRKGFDKEFRELGARYRRLREQAGMVQEDVAHYGFSVRHYQMLEAGRSHNIETLLRVADMFKADPSELLRGLHPYPSQPKGKSRQK